MENPPSADPAAAFDHDPADGIVATSRPPVTFRYYNLVMASFVAILLLSNIIGAAKLTFVDVPFWPDGWWPAPDGVFIYGAGILFFPLGYVIGDVLTEIYGFAKARRVIWTGTAALLFLAFMSYIVTALPAFAGWECSASGFGGPRPLTSTADPAIPGGAICQSTYDSVFGSTWRIVVASITAFWAGEFVNSFVMAKMKVLTKGRGADAIFDPVGGDVFDESVRCIAFDGRLLVIGFTSGRIADVSTNMPLIKGFSVVGVRAGEYGRQFPKRGAENVAQIWDWARAGKTRPRVHAEVALADTLKGFAMLTNRDVVGKVIIRPDM